MTVLVLITFSEQIFLGQLWIYSMGPAAQWNQGSELCASENERTLKIGTSCVKNARHNFIGLWKMEITSLLKILGIVNRSTKLHKNEIHHLWYVWCTTHYHVSWCTNPTSVRLPTVVMLVTCIRSLRLGNCGMSGGDTALPTAGVFVCRMTWSVTMVHSVVTPTSVLVPCGRQLNWCIRPTHYLAKSLLVPKVVLLMSLSVHNTTNSLCHSVPSISPSFHCPLMIVTQVAHYSANLISSWCIIDKGGVTLHHPSDSYYYISQSTPLVGLLRPSCTHVKHINNNIE